ncbi:MAG: hypothetical protein ACE5FN_11305, partial [Leptospirillia bacterium]
MVNFGVELVEPVRVAVKRIRFALGHRMSRQVWQIIKTRRSNPGNMMRAQMQRRIQALTGQPAWMVTVCSLMLFAWASSALAASADISWSSNGEPDLGGYVVLYGVRRQHSWDKRGGLNKGV